MGCSSSASAAEPPTSSHTTQNAQATPPRRSPSKQERVDVQDFHAKYKLGVLIGRGSFAQVRAAVEQKSKAARYMDKAVKILDLRDEENAQEPTEKKIQKARNEIVQWKEVSDHANCVTFYEAFFDKFFCYMVMERCANSFFNYLEDMPVLNEQSLGTLCVQMLSAIRHVHKCRVVHRDVKPDNFVMGGSDRHTLKLADFGLAAAIPASGFLQGIHGTSPFMCPEMLLTRTFDEKADVWSVGVVMHLLLCGELPYQGKRMSSKQMQEAIRNGVEVDCRRSWLSNGAVSFLTSVLSRDPHQRPSSVEVFDLQYIADISKRRHSPKTDLPCLEPVLNSAWHAGVFDNHDLSEEVPIDRYLSDKQRDARSRGMPVSQRMPDDTRKVNAAKLANASSMLGPTANANGHSLSDESTDCGSSWRRCHSIELSD